jgi:hypothetical protein
MFCYLLDRIQVQIGLSVAKANTHLPIVKEMLGSAAGAALTQPTGCRAEVALLNGGLFAAKGSGFGHGRCTLLG